MSSIIRVTLICALLLAGAPGPAGASMSAEQAQRQIFEAQGQFRAGRFDAALAIFREVARQHPPSARDPRLQWNLARCLEELGRYEEALAAFGVAASIAEDQARRARVQAKIEALRAEHFGQIRVECAAGGRVRVEGLVGERACPGRWDLARVGSHRGTMVDVEGRTTPFDVMVRAGELAQITVAAKPPERAPTPVGPPAPPSAAATIEPQPADGGFGPWPWIAAGAGVAALGGSVWFKLDGDAAIDEARTTEDAERYAALRDEHASSAVGHYALLGVGAALVVTGATLFWLDAGEAIAVVPTPGGIGGIVRW